MPKSMPLVAGDVAARAVTDRHTHTNQELYPSLHMHAED